MKAKAKALKIFEKHYERWESDPARLENGYQFEATYAAMIEDLGREVLQASLGEVPNDKNLKKKLQTRFGKLEMDKRHILAGSPGPVAISSPAQETMCHVGQHLVFEEAEHLINSLTGAGFNAKQIERACHRYGGLVEKQDLDNIEVHGYGEVPPDERDKPHYVSVDGSMYFTRGEGWKEIKLGRIFKQEDLVPVSKGRTLLEGSQYVAHLGGIGGFLPKMEYHIENLKNKVFIADGATWIWNWVEDTYPESAQIVDHYHAKEHLCGFAGEYFNDAGQRRQWTDRQGRVMLERGIGPVVGALEGLPGDDRSDAERSRLIAYYKRHRKRMQYHDFLGQGLQIGSGAMESAHKDVLQARLKLSGQRWTMDGLQQMAQLRVVHKSGKWDRIKNLCQKAA